jgi:hypothetical protein
MILLVIPSSLKWFGLVSELMIKLDKKKFILEFLQLQLW